MFLGSTKSLTDLSIPIPTLEMVSLIHSFRSLPTEWQRKEREKRNKKKKRSKGGEGEESARLTAQQAAGSQSIFWEWVNKQRVINAFIQRGEMFCMAWFMELSRLSNSLGSVCSQRRRRREWRRKRRPAGSWSHPSPAPSLAQPALPSMSLLPESRGSCFLCAHECTATADLRGRCACSPWTPLDTLRPWPDLTQPAKSECRASQHNGPLEAGLWLQDAFYNSLYTNTITNTHQTLPAWGPSVAWSLKRMPTASPAVWSDILHSPQTRQGLSGESGERGWEKNLTGDKCLQRNF